MLQMSGVVVNQTFTLGGVDMHTRLFIDYRHINYFIRVLNFDREINLAAKISRSTVRIIVVGVGDLQ